MNKVLAVLISVALTLIQVTLTPMLKIGWLNYNFALVAIVVVCLLCGGKVSIINTVIVSLIYDISAAVFPGTFVLLYLLIALIVELIARHMFSFNIGIAILLIFVATLISELCTYWIFYGLKGMAYDAFILSKIVLPQCLINSIVGLVVFWFYKSVLRLKRE